MISRGGPVALAPSLVMLLVAGCSGGTTTNDVPRAGAASVAPTASLTPAAGNTDYGYFTAVLSAKMPVRLSFDRALFLTGAEADAAAIANGDESPVPNDYYVVNDNKKLRTVVLSSDVLVFGSLALNTYAGGTDKVEASPRTLTELLGFLGTEQGRQTGFHLVYGADGVVVSVEEQYQP